MFEQLPNGHRPWRACEWPLAVIRPTVSELSERSGAAMHEFYDKGLGPARMTGGLLTRDRLIYIVEHDLERGHPMGGPAVYVDAADLAIEGADAMIAELQVALGLATEDLVWVADKSSQEAAAKKLRGALPRHRRPGLATARRAGLRSPIDVRSPALRAVAKQVAPSHTLARTAAP